MSPHPSLLTLRRQHSGESVGDDVRTHTAACPECTTRLQGLRTEQLDFEQRVPFERFAARVEARTPPRRVKTAIAVVVALAASLVLLIGLQSNDSGHNRLKGGASVDFVVAGTGGQRQVEGEPEALAPGERVRVGLTAGSWPYAMVVSIDDRGVVTPIYLENGRSLAVSGTSWLPDSLEFTGRGLERIVVVLSASPLSLDEVSRAVKTAYDAAHGDLNRMTEPQLPGEQLQRTFLKP